jgi:lipopolysaccharide transport system permease protein
MNENHDVFSPPLQGSVPSRPNEHATSSVTIIEPSRGWMPLKLRELWEYREVLYFLVWRDLKVRYRQTMMGAGWAVAQPLSTALVFTIFFGKVAKIPSDGVPYPVFALAGLVPWTFFSNGLSQSANSLVANRHIIGKIYFPRPLLPLSRVVAALPDLGLGFLALLAVMWWYETGNVRPTALFWLPVFILLALVTALGVGLWLSALNVKYRDVQHVLPLLIQLWLFASPLAYPSSLLREPWSTIYGLNPMVGVVDGFRWTLLGIGDPPGATEIVSSLAAITILVTGAFFFRRSERHFADIV